jgi:DnaJ like chaperone protein
MVMRWVGKAVGGLLGFAAGGPVGSLVGALLGHQFDRGFGARSDAVGLPPGAGQRLYFELTFEVMGHLAKSDGRVSEQEIRTARRVMHALRLSPEEVSEAIERFTAGKSSGWPAAARLDELQRVLGDRHDLSCAFLEIQMQALVGAGKVGAEKRDALWRVARKLRVGRVELAQIEALARAHELRGGSRGPGASSAELENAYRVLGVSMNANEQEIKTAYRRLMNQHHPDKLLARGLPASMAGNAEQKTHEIRAAYERIRAHRASR